MTGQDALWLPRYICNAMQSKGTKAQLMGTGIMGEAEPGGIAAMTQGASWRRVQWFFCHVVCGFVVRGTQSCGWLCIVRRRGRRVGVAHWDFIFQLLNLVVDNVFSAVAEVSHEGEEDGVLPLLAALVLNRLE